MNSYLHKRKGNTSYLVLAITCGIVMSILALATAQTIQGVFNGLKVTQIALQAQQYADAKVNLIKAAGFDKFTEEAKKSIPESPFYQEVSEVKESTSNSVKKKAAAVNIYLQDEKSPRYSLPVILYDPVDGIGNCQTLSGMTNLTFKSTTTAKSISLFATSNWNKPTGTWSSTNTVTVSVNNVVIGSLSMTASIEKGGSKGHYWGYQPSVSGAKTFACNVKQGDTITVVSSGGSLFRHCALQITLNS